MARLSELRSQFRQVYGGGGEIHVVSVPGRVNLIGEHIDYHALPVLPIAIRRYVRVVFRARNDRFIRATSAEPYGPREFEWIRGLKPAAAGDWQNYLRAAARLISIDQPIGIDALVISDLPAAAGLSSSTALLVAFTLALLRVNQSTPAFEELMQVLPDGEQFVGTRGGGMDHAAVLASVPGCASFIHFEPLSVRPIAIPRDWGFLIAHSLETAEKSGGARDAFNARRHAGTAALERLGFPSYQAAIEGRTLQDLENLAARLPSQSERDAFLHVTSEALRVETAVTAMQSADAREFEVALLQSHWSLRDRLKVSSPALDRVVDLAMECHAGGARLTGAGFGGFAVVFCRKRHRKLVRQRMIERYYSHRPEFREDRHLIDADPGPGVLYARKAS